MKNFWDSNGPLRGIKRDLYEGGIRSPFMVRWPSKVVANSRSGHISAFWDILPTMAELIGQPEPEQSDGISLLPTLLGNKEQEPHKYLYHEFRHGAGKGAYSSRSPGVRRSRQCRQEFENHDFRPIELYNLKTDLGETTNLANEHPEILARLEGFIKEAHRPLDQSR